MSTFAESILLSVTQKALNALASTELKLANTVNNWKMISLAFPEMNTYTHLRKAVTQYFRQMEEMRASTQSSASALAARTSTSSQRTRGGKHKRTASKMDSPEVQEGKGKKQRDGPCTYKPCGKMGHWEKDCWMKDPSKAPKKGTSSGRSRKPNPKGKGDSTSDSSTINKEVDLYSKSYEICDHASMTNKATKAVAMMASKLSKTNT